MSKSNVRGGFGGGSLSTAQKGHQASLDMPRGRNGGFGGGNNTVKTYVKKIICPKLVIPVFVCKDGPDCYKNECNRVHYISNEGAVREWQNANGNQSKGHVCVQYLLGKCDLVLLNEKLEKKGKSPVTQCSEIHIDNIEELRYLFDRLCEDYEINSIDEIDITNAGFPFNFYEVMVAIHEKIEPSLNNHQTVVKEILKPNPPATFPIIDDADFPPLKKETTAQTPPTLPPMVIELFKREENTIAKKLAEKNNDNEIIETISEKPQNLKKKKHKLVIIPTTPLDQKDRMIKDLENQVSDLSIENNKIKKELEYIKSIIRQLNNYS